MIPIIIPRIDVRSRRIEDVWSEINVVLISESKSGWSLSQWYIFQIFSHFSDIFYTHYFHFLCIFCYVFHLFYYVYLNTYGQFLYLILSWLSYHSKPILPSFYFLHLFSQVTHSGTRQMKLLWLGPTDQDDKELLTRIYRRCGLCSWVLRSPSIWSASSSS